MNEESLTFTTIDDDGQEQTFEMLFTFECNLTGKNYIVYTDNSLDEQGCTRVYASVYDPLEQPPRLQPIVDEEEWALVETVLEQQTAEAMAAMEDEE